MLKRHDDWPSSECQLLGVAGLCRLVRLYSMFPPSQDTGGYESCIALGCQPGGMNIPLELA
jgi:hypothetical protein